MVLLYAREGQLANRLWQAAHFVSNAIEHNYLLLHLGFAEYIIYFNENAIGQLKDHKKVRIIDFETTSKKDRLLIKYANLSLQNKEKKKEHFPFVTEIKFFNQTPGGEGYDISVHEFTKVASKRIVLVDGWQYTDRAALHKHADIIRKIFTPNKKYLNNIQHLKEKSFSKYEKVIGVHLRKGDYSSFNEGKWFYSNADYIHFMKQISLLPSFKNKKVGFLLCSDEKIDPADFEDFSIIDSTNFFVEDLYALSDCDLIIGPPSTFSSWAAFYGNKPLLHIFEKEMKITAGSFKTIKLI